MSAELRIKSAAVRVAARMPCIAFKVWIILKDRTNDDGSCRVRVSTLSEELDKDERNIRAALKWLEENNWVDVARTGKSSVYTPKDEGLLPKRPVRAKTPTVRAGENARSERAKTPGQSGRKRPVDQSKPSLSKPSLRESVPLSHKYVFEGRVIKLNERDYSAWKRLYRHVDLDRELERIDLELAHEGKDKGWFAATSSKLAYQDRKAAPASGRPKLKVIGV